VRIYSSRHYIRYKTTRITIIRDSGYIENVETHPQALNHRIERVLYEFPDFIKKRHIDNALFTDNNTILPSSDEMVAWVNSHRFTGCEVCSEHTFCCLTYHHREPRTKRGEIMRMVRNRMPKSMILAEMDKCTLLCLNCHRKVHIGLLALPCTYR
jgi:hypothetical protein